MLARTPSLSRLFSKSVGRLGGERTRNHTGLVPECLCATSSLEPLFEFMIGPLRCAETRESNATGEILRGERVGNQAEVAPGKKLSGVELLLRGGQVGRCDRKHKVECRSVKTSTASGEPVRNDVDGCGGEVVRGWRRYCWCVPGSPRHANDHQRAIRKWVGLDRDTSRSGLSGSRGVRLDLVMVTEEADQASTLWGSAGDPALEHNKGDR